jgi:hypothetical protein
MAHDCGETAPVVGRDYLTDFQKFFGKLVPDKTIQTGQGGFG